MNTLISIPVPAISLEDFIANAATFGVSPADAETHYAVTRQDQVFGNDQYLVVKRPVPPPLNHANAEGVWWLSIRRIDGKKIRLWADLQEIKNQLMGLEAEMIEVFPPESCRVDSSNQYHLFGGGNWRSQLSFNLTVKET